MTRKFFTPIVLPADPVAAMEAVTKQYVDARAGSEVEIAASDPIGTNAVAELWYDTVSNPAPIPASNISFAPVGAITATDVQSAINTTAPTAWIRLNTLLINGWVDYGAPFGPAFYRKIGDMVYMRGLIQTGNGIICTLPAGYRPPYETILHCPCQTGSAEVRVTTGGALSIPWASTGALPSTWLSLSSMIFSTAA
jgi:hypothetical protein